MIKKIMKNKKMKYSVLVLLAVLVVAVGVTVALLTSNTGAITNTFKTGEITTEIEEEDPEISDTTIGKEPKVKNLGPNDCLVRVRVNVSPSTIAEYLATDGRIAYNTTDWIYDNDDGYWYYNGVLKVGDTTPAVFTEVNGLLEDGKIIGQFRHLDGFDISIYQEAVQAVAVLDDNGTRTYAYDADGNYLPDKAAEIWTYYDAQK